MAMQEKRRPTPPNPEDVVSGMQFFAENIRRDVDFNNRSGSISIKDSLLGLKESLKLEPAKTKSILADTAGDLLEALKEKNTDGYPTYARMDILEGLGGFEDPKMQLVIAKSLDDPQEMVTKRAQDLLTRKGIEIFPETLKFLLNAKDPKNPENYDPEKTELALSIIEKNERAGIWIGTVDATVDEALLGVLLNKRNISGGKHRAAVIAGKFHEIASLDLIATAIQLLYSEFSGELSAINSAEIFDQLVDTIHNSNLSSARTSDDISAMNLILPPDHESLRILLKVFDISTIAGLDPYRQIRALAAQEARKMLKGNIAHERKEEQRRVEQKRSEESLIAEQKRQGREAILRTQETERIKRVKEEKTLAEAARRDFPHLTSA